jgi:hypothetical protein
MEDNNKVISPEELIDQIRISMEYAYLLGYSECLNNTNSGSNIKSSNPDRAIKYYIDTLKIKYGILNQ